jgi:hypothetical protein
LAESPEMGTFGAKRGKRAWRIAIRRRYGRPKQVDDEGDLPHLTLQMHQKDARSP